MFGAPSLGAFVLVLFEGKTLRGIVDDHLLAVGAEFFLFPWGFLPTAIVAAATFASAAATAPAFATTATLGECCHEFCILRHDFQYLLALLNEFGL
jgi:hypothetical protein